MKKVSTKLIDELIEAAKDEDNWDTAHKAEKKIEVIMTHAMIDMVEAGPVPQFNTTDELFAYVLKMVCNDYRINELDINLCMMKWRFETALEDRDISARKHAGHYEYYLHKFGVPSNRVLEWLLKRRIPTFLKITNGPREGSIGRLAKKSGRRYTTPTLVFDDRKIKISPGNYKAFVDATETVYVYDRNNKIRLPDKKPAKIIHDMLDREIHLGDTIIVSGIRDNRDHNIVKVNKITAEGMVHGRWLEGEEDIYFNKDRSHYLIIDKGTSEAMMMHLLKTA